VPSDQGQAFLAFSQSSTRRGFKGGAELRLALSMVFSGGNKYRGTEDIFLTWKKGEVLLGVISWANLEPGGKKIFRGCRFARKLGTRGLRNVRDGMLGDAWAPCVNRNPRNSSRGRRRTSSEGPKQRGNEIELLEGERPNSQGGEIIKWSWAFGE